jgi:hypothetical protein
VPVEDPHEALDGLRRQLDLDRDRSAVEAESDGLGPMAGLVVALVVPPRDLVRPCVEREQLAAPIELAASERQSSRHPCDPAVVRPPRRSGLAWGTDRDAGDRHTASLATSAEADAPAAP